MKRYYNLDGIRTLATIGILFMHVKVNIGYEIVSAEQSNSVIRFILEELIGSAGVLVPLFFMISGFSLCCGYYEKIKNNQMNIFDFYKKRYLRILPYFAILTLLDIASQIIFSHKLDNSSLYEGFANITLFFGFLSNANIQVIGVAWSLGVIFSFYIIFPFFVATVWNKKIAWFSFVVSLGLNFICNVYFKIGDIPDKANFVKWLCFFYAGALLFLYKDCITKQYMKFSQKINIVLSILFVISGIIIGQLLPVSNQFSGTFVDWKQLIGFAIVLLGAMGRRNALLSNCFTSYISNISFEIYLAHMFVFRIVEKLGIISMLGKTLGSYIAISVIVFVLVSLFASVYKRIEKKTYKIANK